MYQYYLIDDWFLSSRAIRATWRTWIGQTIASIYRRILEITSCCIVIIKFILCGGYEGCKYNFFWPLPHKKRERWSVPSVDSAFDAAGCWMEYAVLYLKFLHFWHMAGWSRWHGRQCLLPVAFPTIDCYWRWFRTSKVVQLPGITTKSD